MQSHLSEAQKQTLYDDGYVIVKGAVEDRLVDAANAYLDSDEKKNIVGTEQRMTDLVNESSITPILHEAMGYFDPPKVCQMGITPVSKPSDRFLPA